MRYIINALILSLACFSLAFAEGEHQLPPIGPNTCSTPAEARGNLLVQDFIAEAERANRTVQKVSGGCGMWELSEYQRANLGKLLLHDIILDQPDANCSTMADVNEDGPFGTRTDIVCKKDIKVSEELTVHAYLLISIHLDVDGEAIVIFISAIE